MKNAFRIGISIVICVGLVCGDYYSLSHKNAKSAEDAQDKTTEVEKIIERDFDKKYPKTPREVVKWYNRIITAFYGEDYTDEELEKMADQARSLMDDELLSYNPRDTYLKSLKADIEDYKTRDKIIVQSSVSDSNDITYATVDGEYCAYVDAYYFSREASDYSRTYEEFVLRRDDEGHWKILSFRLTEGDNDE